MRTTAGGWIHDWALAGRNGLGSPEHGPFAHITNETPGVFHSHGGRGTGSIGTLTGAHDLSTDGATGALVRQASGTRTLRTGSTV